MPDTLETLQPWLFLQSSLGIDGFRYPGRALPLLGLLAVALLAAASARPAQLAWPALPEVRAATSARRSSFDGLRAGALALRFLAVACLGLVLCGPTRIDRASPEAGHGLDILLALDTSGSMRALDTSSGGEVRTRLDLAREVVSRFAHARIAEGDRVGLVVFGETAFTQCPLTSDGALLTVALERVEVGMAGEATALGDALGLATLRADAGSEETERLVVLLTDGRSNAGSVPVEIARALAVEAGVRVHTVAIGSGSGSAGEPVAMAPLPGGAREGLRFERHDLDSATLRQIAHETGGRFYAARRPSDLDVVYRDIDALERSERPLPPRIRERIYAQPLLAASGGLLLLELALARVIFRRLP